MKVARIYAANGWAVVPLHDVKSGACSCGKPDCERSAGKHPRLNEWQKHATADAEVVEQWIADYPSANIGIATGAPSGFFVLDVDGDEGRASLAACGDLPTTVRAQTGSGGDHYLFKLPDFKFANSASEIAPGLDIRTTGGQIVVAPSVSAKGKYRWILRPFDVTPIADAPPWLLERLRPRVETAPVVRGEFPPATPEVLAEATEALRELGPAISGEGGDDHTFRACAMLRHDFALTFEESWEVAWHWNQENSPPWSDGDLAAKLRGGEKYGTGEFGSKRKADVLQRVRQLLADWRGAGAELLSVPKLGVEIRQLAKGVDPLVKAIIENEFEAETGLGKRDLQLPKGQIDHGHTPGDGIEVTPRVHEMADKGTAAINEQVFQRTGVLCEIIKGEKNTLIFDLKAARIVDLMSRAEEWFRNDGEKGRVAVAPPMPVAEIMHSRRKHEKIRELDAVTTAPIFLEDGTILQKQGYNAQARVYLEPSVTVDVPDFPDRDEAVGAVETFRDLLCDFKFAEPADFSSWLATLLSPLVKAATKNAPAPLLCVSAPSAGAGKTLLATLIARVVTGGDPEIRPYNPRDPGEWGKRLTAFVKAAAPVNVFDNVNGRFGDEGLDRLVTSPVWSDRILGASDAPPLPVVSTWIATGNNIEPIGDTIRRVLMCRLEVESERPQERTGWRRDPIQDFALAERSRYLSAALTILRAYHCADRPAQQLPSWGSFSAWSALVRGALVWAGCADPFLTQRRAATTFNDAENEQHDFWLSIIDAAQDGSPAIIAAKANASDARAVLGNRDELNAFTLRSFLARFIDRPRGSRRIRRDLDERKQQTRYYVEAVR